MTASKDWAALVGRILLGIASSPPVSASSGASRVPPGNIASKGLPLPEVGAALAIAVEILAGIALVVGWKTRWAALALAVFHAGATVFLSRVLGGAARASR